MPKTTKRKHGTNDGSSVTLAFRQLRKLIVLGHLSPGSWIVESDIAKRLGLSRTPVRGAIQLLQREGYIVRQRGSRKTRIVIAPLTKEDARELYMIVSLLEGFAGSLIASHSQSSRDTLCDELQKLNSQLNDIATQTPVDPRRIFDLDRELHARIFEAGAGPRLLALHRSVKPQVERYWRLYASTIINELHHSVTEHNAIIASIREGNAQCIREALERNWTAGLGRMSKVIELFGERGSW